jgi:hypothetical protein
MIGLRDERRREPRHQHSEGHAMKFHRRRFLHLVGVAAAVAVLSVTVTGHGAWSQTARTIKVVVPVQPGGSNDFLARVLGEEIGRAQGPTMVIENRPGAGSIIGTEAVSHAAPDGNSLLITSPTVVINPHLRKVNYDPLTSFEPICTWQMRRRSSSSTAHHPIGRSPICLTRHAPSPAI